MYSQPGYHTEVTQAIQHIALVVFGAVDQPFASCRLVHFLEIKCETKVGFYVRHNAHFV